MNAGAQRAKLIKALPHLPLTPTQKDIILIIATHGRGNTWILMHGHSVGRRLSVLTKAQPRTCFEALAALEERGLILRGKDENERTTLTLTQRLYDGADVTLQRQHIQTLVGPEMWELLNGDDAVADAIQEAVESMPHGRYRDQVRQAARAMLLGKQAKMGDAVRHSPDYGGHRRRNVVPLRSAGIRTQDASSRTQSADDRTQKRRSTR